MLDTQKCRFCRNAEVRHGIIGTSYLCAAHNSAKVKKNFCREKFVQDDDMVQEYALFKARDPHKKYECGNCVYREGILEGHVLYHKCRYLNITFCKEFSPHTAVCLYHESGGKEATINLMCDLVKQAHSYDNGNTDGNNNK